MLKRFLYSIVICLTAVALLFTAACSAMPAEETAKAGIVITEAVSSNKRSLIDEALGSPDWIELYNASDAPIDLNGYGISDNVRKLYKFTFPSVTIGAGEYLVIYAAENNGVERTDVLCTGFGLSKSGDALYLCDGFYEIVQELNIPTLLTDASYARRADGTYGYCASPTPGAANTTEIVDDPDLLFANETIDALAITEVRPDGDAEAWMEIMNVSDTDVRLDDYYVSDSQTNPMRFQLPESTLKAGNRAVIYLNDGAGDGDRIEASFTLGRADTWLCIANWQGVIVSELTWEADVPAGLTVVVDENGAAKYTAHPTPNAENDPRVFDSIALTDMDESDPIRISEALRKNRYSIIDSDGDRGEWVELFNASDAPVSLHGYYLSDRADDPFKWAMPDVSLGAGEYLVVFLSGKDRTEGELHASFALSDAEEGVYLTCLDGMRCDTMLLPTDLKENISVGVAEDGTPRYYAQPTPGYANTYGFETADQIGFFHTEGVYISEVSAVSEAKSGKNDWIELYNGSSEAVDLSGWYLSDDDADPLKYQIGNLQLDAGGYAVIETTSHPTRQKEGVATFGISPAGDTLVLSDANGLRVDTFETGVLSVDVTSGRIEGDATVNRVFFQKSTRGKKNSAESVTGYAAAPIFSECGLYHTESFRLTITTATADAEIRYTTNGAEPTHRDKLYTEPITVSKNTVIRAAAFKEGLQQSAVTTFNYLFEKPHTLPVVCVNGDPENIRDVLAAKKRSEKVEREAFIQYYEPSGELGTEFPCGIKAKGAGTLVYPQKSLAIHLRGGYGRTEVTYPFFPDTELTTFVSLVLRNSGQDFGDHVYDARVRDSFLSRAVVGMNLDYAMTRPVIMYLNGEYYGLYDFNEDQNKDYLVNHYGIDGDAVDIIQRNSNALQGTNKDIKRVFDFAVSKDLSDDAVFAEFAEWIDVPYFTDYFIAQTYFCNADMFNQKYWRSHDYTVKWRPILYDLDYAFSTQNGIGRDIIPHYFSEKGVPSRDGSLTKMNIYVGLQKNEAWRQMCAERYVEIVCTYFQPERMLKILDELVKEMEPEMERHIKKWGRPKSMSAWRDSLDQLRSIIRNRPQHALDNMQKYFRISDAQMQAWIKQYSK